MRTDYERVGADLAENVVLLETLEWGLGERGGTRYYPSHGTSISP